MSWRKVQFQWLISLLFLPVVAYSLMCFRCTSNDNPSCGMYFKPYQFRAIRCVGPHNKCGLQREPPERDGWVAIVRDCYAMGSLKGINESNGCKNWTADEFSAKFCFCDTDFCNSGTYFHTNVILIAAIIVSTILFISC